MLSHLDLNEKAYCRDRSISGIKSGVRSDVPRDLSPVTTCGAIYIYIYMLNFSIANYRRVLDKARLGAGIKCKT